MIVLDTCTIIWAALQPNKLSKKAKSAINKANLNDGICFCEISLWEIAMLIKKERVDPGVSYLEFIDLVLKSNKYALFGITPQIADCSVNLPKELSQDPADRIIVATSMENNWTLVTIDKNIREAACVKTLW